MFCEKCGKNVAEGSRFCDGCGSPVGAPLGQSIPSGAASDLVPISGRPLHDSSRKAPWIILAIFLLVMAVLGYEMMVFKQSGRKASSVDVSVSPAQLTLKPGESHLVEATVLGTENSDVTWSVAEGASGGAIVAAGATAHDGHVFSAGRYTAPGTPGTYHVIATSKADEMRASGVTVTVTR